MWSRNAWILIVFILRLLWCDNYSCVRDNGDAASWETGRLEYTKNNTIFAVADPGFGRRGSVKALVRRHEVPRGGIGSGGGGGGCPSPQVERKWKSENA